MGLYIYIWEFSTKLVTSDFLISSKIQKISKIVDLRAMEQRILNEKRSSNIDVLSKVETHSHMPGCLFLFKGDVIKIGSSCQYFFGSFLSSTALNWLSVNSFANCGLRAPFLNFPSFHWRSTLPYDHSGTLAGRMKYPYYIHLTMEN